MTPLLLIESALRASVLGLGAWVLLRLLRIRCPAQERVAWLVVLIGSMVMPIAASIAHRIWPDTSTDSASALGGLLGSASLLSDAPQIGAVRDLLWPAYLSVAAVLVARLGAGLFILSRHWRDAIPVPALSQGRMSVRVSHRVTAPVSIGAGILLPESWPTWTEETRESVLAHERSHVRRGDFYWQLLTHAHLALFWASPLSWWLRHRVTLLAEQLSDDAAIATHGSAIDYAALLLEFSGMQRSAFLTVAMARPSHLSSRIERLVRRTSESAARRTGDSGLFGGLLVLAMVSIMNPWLIVAAEAPATPAYTRQSAQSELAANFPVLSPLRPLQTRLRSLDPLKSER